MNLAGFAVYNITILCLLGVPASTILPADQLDTKYAITGTLIIACTTFTLCLVFLPKVCLLGYKGLFEWSCTWEEHPQKAWKIDIPGLSYTCRVVRMSQWWPVLGSLSWREFMMSATRASHTIWGSRHGQDIYTFANEANQLDVAPNQFFNARCLHPPDHQRP